jgi:hypothetical protein
MTDDRDPFERRLAERLGDLSDTPLAGPKPSEPVARAAMASPSQTWRIGLLAITVLVAGVVAMVVLSRSPTGVASQSTSPSPSPSPGALASLEYSCYPGYPFRREIFDEPELDLESLPAGVRLARFIEAGGGGNALPRNGWHLAGMDNSRAAFVAMISGDPPYAQATVGLDDGEWRLGNWGRCLPKVDIGGLSAATWRLAPEQEIDTATTSFLADVVEWRCTGGQSSEDRVRPPLIAYQPQRVVVVFTVDPPPPPPDNVCIANPATRVSVELSEPLGDRELLDGGALPWHDPNTWLF